MLFSASNKITLFIDDANLYATARALGFDIDYKRLLTQFQGRGTLLRALYYTAIIDDQESTSIRPLIDWLHCNGHTVVIKAIKEFSDASGRRKVKGNMDIKLAVHAMELAEHIDRMVLFSGDGNFRPLVEALQRAGRAGYRGFRPLPPSRRWLQTICAARPTTLSTSSIFGPSSPAPPLIVRRRARCGIHAGPTIALREIYPKLAISRPLGLALHPRTRSSRSALTKSAAGTSYIY